MVKVTAAILIHQNKILIARRKDNDPLAGKWEFPGGKIEQNETPEQCLTREMKEEFGIDVLVGEFFGESIYRYGPKTIQLLGYRAVWTAGKFSLNAHADYKWVSLEQLQDFDFAPADINFVNKLLRENI